MREPAICEAVPLQVLAIASAHRARRVASITLRIGPLAGGEPELLSWAFPLVAAGTLCAAADIEFEATGVTVECTLCGAVSGARPNRLLYAACGTWRLGLSRGDEMPLSSVDLFELEIAQLQVQPHV